MCVGNTGSCAPVVGCDGLVLVLCCRWDWLGLLVAMVVLESEKNAEFAQFLEFNADNGSGWWEGISETDCAGAEVLGMRSGEARLVTCE